MGLAKHFYTMRQQGERVPAHVYRFFEYDGTVEKSPKKKKVDASKPKKKSTDMYVDELLKDLF